MNKKNFLFFAVITLFVLSGLVLLLRTARAYGPYGSEIAAVSSITNPDGSYNDPSDPGNYVDVTIQVVDISQGYPVFDLWVDGAYVGSANLVSQPVGDTAVYRVWYNSTGVGTHSLEFFSSTASTIANNASFIAPPAQVTVTSNYSAGSWYFVSPASPNLCSQAACSGSSTQRYSFPAINATVIVHGNRAPYKKFPPTITSQAYSLKQQNNFLAKLINVAQASSCAGDTCTGVNNGGAVGFDVNYSDPGSDPAYHCTINVVGTWNGQYSKATGAPFTISGPSSINGTDSNGYESYSALTDPTTGANYTFTSPSTQASVNPSYPSTSTSVSQSGACTSGGTLTFTLSSQSNPIIDVH